MTLKRAGRIAYYYGVNSIFGACIYFGFFEDVEGAKNIALFMAWVLSILGTLLFGVFMIDEVKKQMAKKLYEEDYKPSAPYVLDLVFDMCVLGVFVWFGHYVLAVFYILHMSAGKTLRDLGKEYTFKNLIADKQAGK